MEEVIETTTQPKPRTKDRVTVVEQCYYQAYGDSPVQFSNPSFTLELESNEQPYTRKLVISEEWLKLDLGWIENCGLLLIFNDEGRFLQTMPTLGERLEASKRVVELGFGEIIDADASKTAKFSPPSDFNPKLYFPPQFGTKLILSDSRGLFVRSQAGSAKIVITAISK